MDWRMARSLETLRVQLNTLFPNRSKASDGGIGDAAHASRDSDHNPWYGPGIVTARDFTHDPGDGINCHWLAAQLVNNHDSRIKYIIWNRQIWTPGLGWRPYNGANPHTSHLHLSVVALPACDHTRRWILTSGEPPQERDDEMQIRLCRDKKNAKRGTNVVTPFGYWKLPNERALRDFCHKWGLDPRPAPDGDVEENDETGWWGPNLTP